MLVTSAIIDDLSREPPIAAIGSNWQLLTDQVMGGVSKGTMVRDIGLPRPGQGVRPEMNAVLLASSEYVELDAAPGAGIDDPTIGREIEGDLNKAAIVFEADVAACADGGPAGDLQSRRGVADGSAPVRPLCSPSHGSSARY